MCNWPKYMTRIENDIRLFKTFQQRRSNCAVVQFVRDHGFSASPHMSSLLHGFLALLKDDFLTLPRLFTISHEKPSCPYSFGSLTSFLIVCFPSSSLQIQYFCHFSSSSIASIKRTLSFPLYYFILFSGERLAQPYQSVVNSLSSSISVRLFLPVCFGVI